jgi:camelysin-like metallo-endopeptidase
MMSKRRAVAATLVVLAALAGVMAIGVSALFTDSQSVGANNFTTGSIDLTASPASSAISYANMMPGDTVTSPLTVSNPANSTNQTFRYSMVSTTTENTLAGQLDLTVKVAPTAAACTTANFGTLPAAIYGPADLGSTGGTNVIGNPAQGQQTGDRSLANGASEVLCLQANLPLATGNAFQALSTTATFGFQAEQTANNP